MHEIVTIRDARAEEAGALGELMVEAYTALEGFPTPLEQPAYYAMLRNSIAFARQPEVRVLVAHDVDEHLLGGLVYFGDMAFYGSGGSARHHAARYVRRPPARCGTSRARVRRGQSADRRLHRPGACTGPCARRAAQYACHAGGLCHV